MTVPRAIAGLLFAALSTAVQAAEPPFKLTDSGLDTEEFKRRFLGSYDINEALEPKLSQDDRPLYESIAPHLRSDPKQAIRIATAGLTPESNPAFHFLLGNLNYQIEDYANCEKHLRAAIEKFPSFRRAHRTLALAHIQREQYDKAVSPLLKVIKLGGGDDQSYGLLAYSFLTLEKHESALSAYRMARMFKPDSPDFKRGQAHCLSMTHQHKAAIALFDELIAEQPEERDFWLQQANAFLETGQKKKAIANLEIVADAGKADWASLTLLADLYLDQDTHTLAAARYKKALTDFPPNDPVPATRPLKHLIERSLFAEAREYLKLLREKFGGSLKPDSREARTINIAEAEIEMEIGDGAKGLSILEDALKSDPLNGRILLLVGQHHLQNEDYQQADLHLNRALSDPDKQVEARVALGRLAVEQRKFTEAVRHLQKAQDLRADSNVARYIAAIQRAIGAEK